MKNFFIRVKKIFIICPVRIITDEQRQEIDDYIKQKKEEGFSVHSYKNINQVDPTGGVNICAQHRKVMLECDEVHVFFDAASSGSHFDFGMAFVLDKPIKLVKVYQPTPIGKSYQAVLEKITIK
jgi:nucleoside 2-deoxyribosyltransferase